MSNVILEFNLYVELSEVFQFSQGLQRFNLDINSQTNIFSHSHGFQIMEPNQGG